MGFYLLQPEIREIIQETVKQTIKQNNTEQSLRHTIQDLHNQNRQLRKNIKELKQERKGLKKEIRTILRNKTRRRPLGKNTRHRILERDNYRCQECGATNKDTTLTIDHIVPLSRGGKDNEDNLWVLCEDCNFSKANHIFEGTMGPEITVINLEKDGVKNK